MSEHDPDAAPAYMNIIEWMGRVSVVGMHWYELIDLGEAHVRGGTTLLYTLHAADTPHDPIILIQHTTEDYTWLHVLCYIILLIKLFCYI